MTTTVKVSAHCADDKQVRVTVSGDNNVEPPQFIQNGEEAQVVVYDDRVVRIREEDK
jgi:hypothetical protein